MLTTGWISYHETLRTRGKYAPSVCSVKVVRHILVLKGCGKSENAQKVCILRGASFAEEKISCSRSTDAHPSRKAREGWGTPLNW